MKTLIAAALLLALTSPAFAAKANPRDFPDIRKWQHLNWQCHYEVRDDYEVDAEITQEDYDKTRRGKICLAAKALEKKLEARGYCTYGRSAVGKAGSVGGKYHCYTITN